MVDFGVRLWLSEQGWGKDGRRRGVTPLCLVASNQNLFCVRVSEAACLAFCGCVQKLCWHAWEVGRFRAVGDTP